MKIFKEIINEGFNQKSNKDRRKKINFLICSYLDIKGAEYRKKFEFDKSVNTFDKMFKKIPTQIS